MRKIIIILLALMLPTLAAAQNQIPLPFQSVWGRLGAKPGDSGPGQAIPFTSLLGALKGIAWGGKARMIPHVGQTTSPSDCYTLTDPYGNPIVCTSATTTQGLQEFLNATAGNGWPAEVDCQGTVFPSQTEPIFINASTTVTIPVAQDWSFHSYGCNLNSVVTTVPAMIVDSQGATVFDWDGKIVYSVSNPNGDTTINPSCVVLIKPTTNTADGFPGLYAGYFRIKSPVNNPLGGANSTGVVCIDATGGSTIEQRLDFTEINANNNAYYGMLVAGATSTTGLMQTEIDINQIHGAINAGLNVGKSSSFRNNFNSNQWKINNIENSGASSRGIDTWGSYDNFQIGAINNAQGGLQYGIVTEVAATANHFDYGNISGFSTGAYLDNGTCTWLSGPQGSSLALYGTTSGCLAVQAPAAASGTTTLSPGTMTTFPTNATSRNVLLSPSSAVAWSASTLPTATGPIGASGWAELKPFPSQGAGAWHATDPYGNDISTSGTTCQGLDSLISAASTNGWSWRVIGNGSITCTAPVAVPVCFERHEYIDSGVKISWSAQGSSNLLVINSHENCTIRFMGELKQAASDTGYVVSLAPTSATPPGNTVFAASEILFGGVVPASTGNGVKMDLASGSIIGNSITITDVNGGATGIQVTSPGSGSIVFEHNKLFFTYNHGQTTRVVQVGTSSTNQGNLHYNTWHSGRIDPNAATVAWDSWASNDTYVGLTITNETAAATTGLKFESGANGNTVVGGAIQATTALSDGGAGNIYSNVKGLPNVSYPGRMRYCVTGVNFNAANTDTALPISFQGTRWQSLRAIISNASASISTATVGIFTGTGGTGQTLVANQAITVTATAADTNNNMMSLTLTNGTTMAYTDTTLQVRVGTAQGSAATADVCIEIAPLT